MDFHTLLTELLNWIAEAEAKVSKLDPVPGASSTDIRNEVNSLDKRLFYFLIVVRDLHCFCFFF